MASELLETNLLLKQIGDIKLDFIDLARFFTNLYSKRAIGMKV